MRITGVTLTLFVWDDLPRLEYSSLRPAVMGEDPLDRERLYAPL